jgi:glycerol-3-phosphate acyltransferase PlsY
VCAFFVGAIPFGWILARFAKGIDLRTVGSGGTGATNFSRLWQGPQAIVAFLVVFTLDFAKGIVGSLISTTIAANLAGAFGADAHVMALQVCGGLAAIFGHMFTPFLRFQGGKGVATSFGVVFALTTWPVMLCGLVAWTVLILLTRYMSLASMGAMVGIAVGHAVIFHDTALTARLPITLFLFAAAAAVIWRHRGNIQRILAGTERRLGAADQKL